MKCEKIEWSSGGTVGERIITCMSFDSFEQSHRFFEMVKGFVLAEKKPRQILDDIAWYCPPTDTGSVT